jgi:hypothetical protein
MNKILAATAAIALLSASAVLPGAAHAQPARLSCDQTVNTQHPATDPQGTAVNTDRRAPCERIEGTGKMGMSGSGSGTVGTTGPGVNMPPSTQGGGAGESQ